MKFLSLFFLLICAVCEFGAMARAFGHGFAGARFFPATLSTDDPFVSDELSLPTVSTIRTPENGGTRETDISMEISKRITPDFAIEIGNSFRSQSARRARGKWVRRSGVRREVSAVEKRPARSDCLDRAWRGSRWHGWALGGRRFIQHVDAGNFFRQRLWRFTRGRTGS